MKANEIAHIEYRRSTDLGGGEVGEVTERWIIPTFIPTTNIKALDVSELSEEEQQKFAALWSQYQQYYREAAKTLFDFETWVEHTTDEKVDVKWRTFKSDNITLLD